jgi:ribonuclease D
MATTAVVAGTAGAVHHRQANKYAQKEQQAAYEAQAQQDAIDAAAAQAVAAQQAQYAPPPPQYAPPPPAQDDTMAQLQKLAEMNKQGVLTDEEFAAMKAKLLGL